MASTYSSSLKFTLIGDGEQAGTWGSTTNNNLSLVEQAVTGVDGIDLTGLTTYTLTTFNGTTDESRNAVLLFTGTPASTVTITTPLQNKFYIIRNLTGQTITISASGGSVSLSIPSGVTAQVYCDATNQSGTGTGFYSAQTGSASNFTVNGNLSVTGVGSINGDLSIIGNTTINNNLNVTGATTMSSLNCTTGASFSGASFSGAVTLSSLTCSGAVSFLPRGTIVMFYGSNYDKLIWALCDGKTDGVPNLVDKFVRYRTRF
jgi:hypothetical protein